MNASVKSKRSWLIPLLLIGIIVGPFLFAWVLVQKGHLYEMRSNHHGDLIASLPNIKTVALFDVNKKESMQGSELLGKWWLMYVGPEKCYSECHDIVYNMRQIRTALGKDTHRLERIFLADHHCPDVRCEQYVSTHYPDMLNVRMEPSAFEKLFANISHPAEREVIGELYIIDPKGHIMMHYSADIESKSVLADLKRLLKLSKIG